VLTVRPALASELPAALEVWRAAQAATGLRPAAVRVARVQAKLVEGLLVVAVDGDTVVGMAVGEPGRDGEGTGDAVPGLLHLSMLFVAPARQRQGVGTQLVEGLADAAWGQGYRSVSVWTSVPEFFEACGLERSGRSQLLPEGSEAAQLTAELEAPVREVVVRSDGIRLGQLLKLAGLVDTGSEGKELLTSGTVEVNGEVELRRGRQLTDGDEVRAREQAVRVRCQPA